MFPEKLASLFNLLDSETVRYTVLKKMDVFPYVDGSQDIDVIVHPMDKKCFYDAMRRSGFMQVEHPWNFGDNFQFLYSMNPLEFYTLQPYSIDVCFELCCRSLNNGEWIPLHQDIQDLLWVNRQSVSDPWLYELPVICELIHLITKSVYDKREFSKKYQVRIRELYNIVDLVSLEILLSNVFYKYTPRLLRLISDGKFAEIFDDYVTFKEY